MQRSAPGNDLLDLIDRGPFTPGSPDATMVELDEESWADPSTGQRFTTRIIFGIIAAGVLGAAATGVWLATTSYRSGPVADDEHTPAPEPTAADIQAAIETTVRGYMEAPDDLARCRWVVGGDGAAAAMRDFYARPGMTPPQGFSRILELAPAAFDGFPMHMVVAAEPDEKTAQMLSVFPVGGKMLIDWESSVIFGEQSWDEFVTVKPTHPTQMRVYLKRGRYYNFAFADDLLWDNYEVTTRDHYDKLQAYVESGSELAQRLQVFVLPRAIQPINVRLKWADQGRALVITELLHNYWVDLERLRRLSATAGTATADTAPQNVGFGH